MKRRCTHSIFFGLVLMLLGSTNGIASSYIRPQLPYMNSLQTTQIALQKDSTIKQNERKLNLRKPQKSDEDGDYSNRRIGYLGLFVLGTFLSYATLILSIFGFFGGGAVLGIIGVVLSSYFLAGGIYFLINAFSENLKPFLEMDVPQKKRERRKFLFTWLGTLLIFGFFISAVTRIF